MAGFKRIVAAVDLSMISTVVIAAAKACAKRCGGELTVLHVMEEYGEEDERLLLPILRGWVEDARRETREAFDELLKKAFAPGEQFIEKLLEGSASEHVLAELNSSPNSLLFMGAPHPGRSLAATLGKVLRGSTAPVVIARNSPAESYNRVVIAVDLSNLERAELEPALALSAPGASFTLVNIIPTGAFKHNPQEVKEVIGLREKLLRRWAEQEGLPNFHSVVVAGDPREALLEEAKRANADLLAVGMHSGGRLRHLLLGSVAKESAHKAHCDVLLSPPRALKKER
ncbi:MAG: hypothetical protein C0608_03650 [Deltaproteobacteria bacterium]|nr:MAG: hypothetical protein C0608_03650 [Deltaproteobacteria bacterium]